MHGNKREQRIRKAVEDKLSEVLRGIKEIKKEELQALSLGIKYLAVSAKLGEQEWGKDLGGLVDPADELDGKGGETEDESSNDF